jgi:hypothetical protein
VKRFFVSTDPMGAKQERELKDKLGHVGWWHWLPNFWLITDRSESLTAGRIRDYIHELDSSVRAIVMEISCEDWAALTKPDSEGRDMAAWLNDTWKDDP